MALGLLVNENATNMDEKKVFELRDILGGWNDVYATQDISEVYDVVSQMAGKYNKITIAGGDSTTFFARSCLNDINPDIYPSIIELGGGSFNIVKYYCDQRKTRFARRLVSRVDPVKNLKRLLENEENGKKTERVKLRSIDVSGDDLRRVDHNKGGIDSYQFPFDTYSSLLMGFGLPYNVIQEYEKGGGKGVRKALKLAKKLIWSAATRGDYVKQILDPVSFEMYDSGGEQHGWRDYTAVMASTIGLITMCVSTFDAFPKHGNTEGDAAEYFQMIATGRNPLQLFNDMDKIARGKISNTVGWMNYCSKYLRLKALDENIPVMMEGELFLTGENLELKLGRETEFEVIN